MKLLYTTGTKAKQFHTWWSSSSTTATTTTTTYLAKKIESIRLAKTFNTKLCHTNSQQQKKMKNEKYNKSTKGERLYFVMKWCCCNCNDVCVCEWVAILIWFKYISFGYYEKTWKKDSCNKISRVIVLTTWYFVFFFLINHHQSKTISKKRKKKGYCHCFQASLFFHFSQKMK